MILCLAMFIAAPMVGWWMPEGVSTHAWDVDFLFYVILYITGFFFVLTEAMLCYFLWKYAGGPRQPEEPRQPGFIAKLTAPVTRLLHDQHRVEMAWTLVPAVILLYIAFAQVPTWARVKYQSKMPNLTDMPVQIDVSARQFEWRMRYPSSERIESWLRIANPDKKQAVPEKEAADIMADYKSFAKHPHKDDLHTVNELHVWKGHPVMVHLSTRDVIHSFNLPQLRVKQDALPGKQFPVWFTPTKENTRWSAKTSAYVDGINPVTGEHDELFIWDLACAELCGWGHFRMIGRIYVHKDESQFLDWLKKAEAKNRPPQ
jgi:cytochrome c oxidase subunit 2